jgi:hypothetical protein
MSEKAQTKPDDELSIPVDVADSRAKQFAYNEDILKSIERANLDMKWSHEGQADAIKDGGIAYLVAKGIISPHYELNDEDKEVIHIPTSEVVEKLESVGDVGATALAGIIQEYDAAASHANNEYESLMKDREDNVTSVKADVTEHLDAYTEAARRDAEAHGIEINLPPTQPE